MIKIPVGVQLFTVRNELAEDVAGTIKRIAEVGYQGFELLPKGWPELDVMKGLLDETGLKMFSAHVPLDRLRDDFDAVAEYCGACGATDLVVPSMGGPVYKDDALLKKTVDDIADIGRKCIDAGFRCSYHNHATEFENTVDGMEVLDYVFETIPADLLLTQLDTFFIEHVGKNPAEYIRRFKGRLSLLHLKDKSKDPSMQNTELGNGTIDWDAVFEAANEVGPDWLIVEQNCQGMPALDSIAASYEFLKSKGIA